MEVLLRGHGDHDDARRARRDPARVRCPGRRAAGIQASGSAYEFAVAVGGFTGNGYYTSMGSSTGSSLLEVSFAIAVPVAFEIAGSANADQLMYEPGLVSNPSAAVRVGIWQGTDLQGPSLVLESFSAHAETTTSSSR